MITADRQFAPNGTGEDPDASQPAAWVRVHRGLAALIAASIVYIVFALAWSVTGSRDADFARAAAFAAACGSSAALIISILATHAEREIKSARRGWTAIALAAGAASAAAIASMYAVWADGAVLWRPVELRWIEAGSSFTLLIGAVLLARGAALVDDDFARLFSLLTLVLGLVAPVVIAGAVAIGGWPDGWSLAAPVLGTAAAASSAVIVVASLEGTGWVSGSRSLGLVVASIVWIISPLLQDIGVWSSNAGWAAFGRWLFPVATLGLTVAILNPGSLAHSLVVPPIPPAIRTPLDGPLPIAVWGAMAIAAAVALVTGKPIAADLSVLASVAAVFLFGRYAWSLRGERRRVQRLMDSTVELERIANVDMVTGLPNRAALDARLAEEMERAIRYAQPLSVLFVDIDHFKRVNDAHGHAAGDRALREVASRLQATARSIDFVGRYGGEEFVVIAPGTWSEDAVVFGERLRAQVERTPVEGLSAEPLFLTVSMGIAGFPEHADTLKSLTERADQALYRSKANGRNRVTLFGSQMDE